MKYPQVYDNEWIVPVMKGWRLRCCSCDLIHVVDFKIVKGAVMLRARVCKRATAAARRKKK